MENLKVTIHLASAVCLDRNTTIDGILLSCYYAYLKNNAKTVPFDKDHKSVKFIERVSTVFSGSVWYIDSTDDVLFDFHTITKKQEYKKIYKYSGKKTWNDPKFKAALVYFETMLVDKIYFYIKADKNITEQLLNSLKFIGKNQNLGFGKVTKTAVDVIDDDKGFFLDAEKTIVSKPLDCRYFDVKSKAVAFHRNMPPYWLNEDLTPCYMPSNILIEAFIRSANNQKYTALPDTDYISNVRFLYENRDDRIIYNSFDYLKGTTKKLQLKPVERNSTHLCAFAEEVCDQGIITNAKTYIETTRRSFADFSYVKNSGFISNEALWCLENIKQISYALVEKKSYTYLQGKEVKEETQLKHYIKDPTLLKPPFSINLKDTSNAQHVSFKGKVSISNGYYYLQYGNQTLHIDSDTLERAILEIHEITKNNKEVTKTHLCGNYRDWFYPEQKMTKNRDNNFNIIMNFRKKYSSDIRHLLSIVAY